MFVCKFSGLKNVNEEKKVEKVNIQFTFGFKTLSKNAVVEMKVNGECPLCCVKRRNTCCKDSFTLLMYEVIEIKMVQKLMSYFHVYNY